MTNIDLTTSSDDEEPSNQSRNTLVSNPRTTNTKQNQNQKNQIKKNVGEIPNQRIKTLANVHLINTEQSMRQRLRKRGMSDKQIIDILEKTREKHFKEKWVGALPPTPQVLRPSKIAHRVAILPNSETPGKSLQQLKQGWAAHTKQSSSTAKPSTSTALEDKQKRRQRSEDDTSPRNAKKPNTTNRTPQLLYSQVASDNELKVAVIDRNHPEGEIMDDEVRARLYTKLIAGLWRLF